MGSAGSVMRMKRYWYSKLRPSRRSPGSAWSSVTQPTPKQSPTSWWPPQMPRTGVVVEVRQRPAQHDGLGGELGRGRGGLREVRDADLGLLDEPLDVVDDVVE